MVDGSSSTKIMTDDSLQQQTSKYNSCRFLREIITTGEQQALVKHGATHLTACMVALTVCMVVPTACKIVPPETTAQQKKGRGS